MLELFDYLGPVPSEEECAQVGSEDYVKRAKAECAKYVKLLKKVFPLYKRYNCDFKVVPQPHDFGTYYEVILYCDIENSHSVRYAEFINDNCPQIWDDDEPKEYEPKGE